MRRLLSLAPLILLAGCGLFSSVDTDDLENDIRVRLIAQGQMPSGIPSGPPSSSPPAVSVSCPSNVSNEKGARFRCSATTTRFNAGPGQTTPSTPGLSTPSAETQRYEVNVRVVDDSGAVRWTARPVD